MRFVHSADWQIGMTRHFLDADAQARFSAARLDAIRRIAALARDVDASFVLVCGDIFESNQLDRRVLARTFDALLAIDVPVYLLPGNHDPLDAASIYRSAEFVASCPDHVHVLDEPGAQVIAPGVEIVAAPWTSKHPLGDLVGAITRELLPAVGVRRIVAGHGIVDSLSPDALDPALIRLTDVEAAIARGGVDYVALGDRHSTTSVGSTGRVWYAGTPEQTDYDEVDPGQVLVVEMADGDVAVSPHRVGRWRFVREQFHLNGATDIDELSTWLNGIADKDCVVLKLALVGTLSLRERSRVDELLDNARDVFAAIEVWERRSELVTLPDEADFDELGLAGFAATAVDELRASASAGDDVAHDALALLYRLAGAR